jgi:DedD protein
MEEGSKRRLVGTAVIVLLLVIFLPMLLEEEPQEPVSDAELAIPPSPDFDEGFDPGLSNPPAETFAVPSDPEPAVTEFYPETAEAEPTAVPAEQHSPAPEPRAEVGAEPVAEPTPEPGAAPEPARSAGDGPSWIIQVASLSEMARAEKLEQTLRSKGFPAFVEKAVVRGKTYHRVRLGPELSRKEIEAMAASLREKTGHKGQIQVYQ